MATFQSPARWVYDYRREQLDLIIGLGEITPANYDGFAPQGLDRLPPLQTFVFNSREMKTQTLFSLDATTKARAIAAGELSGHRGYTLSLGDRTKVTSFGLAAPYDEKGVSALPVGFKPLSIHKIAMLPQRDLKPFVSQMVLAIEGEITDLGQTPPVFCGAWTGGLKASQINDKMLIAVDARQCFVTARITRVSVVRRGAVLATWPR